MSGAGLVVLDVFLFEPEFFGRVQDEHLHANIGGHLGGGRFGDDDHERDRERHTPDGGLFTENAEQRVFGPKTVERCEAGEDFAHWALVESEGPEVR